MKTSQTRPAPSRANRSSNVRLGADPRLVRELMRDRRKTARNAKLLAAPRLIVPISTLASKEVLPETISKVFKATLPPSNVYISGYIPERNIKDPGYYNHVYELGANLGSLVVDYARTNFIQGISTIVEDPIVVPDKTGSFMESYDNTIERIKAQHAANNQAGTVGMIAIVSTLHYEELVARGATPRSSNR